MHKEAKEELRVRFKYVVLEYANHVGVTKTCREFNVARSTFYNWKQKYDNEGRSGRFTSSTCKSIGKVKGRQRRATQYQDK